MKLTLRLLTALLLVSLCGCAGPNRGVYVTSTSTRTSHGVSTTEALLQFQGEQLHAIYTGEVVMSPDDTTVESLDEGARLEIAQTSGTTQRRVSFRRSDSGAVVVDHYIGERRVVADKAAEAWSRAAVLELVARLDLGGEQRAQRLLRAGGAAAVLDHLEFTTHGGFAASYLPYVLRDEALADDALPGVTQRASRLTSSSSTLAKFLTGVCERAPADAALSSAILEAAQAISSSSARSEVLAQVLATRRLEQRQLLELIAQAGSLSSASSCAYVLKAVLETPQELASWRTQWLSVVEALPSTARQTELYGALLAHPQCDAATRVALAHAAGRMASVSGQSAVLAVLIPSCAEDRSVFDASLAMIAALPSTAGQESALLAMLDLEALDGHALAALSAVTKRLSSNSARARVQERLLERLLPEPQ